MRFGPLHGKQRWAVACPGTDKERDSWKIQPCCCDGLWPLLTLGQSQLERLRLLLDAQSDEHPDVQQQAELAQNHGSEVEFVSCPAEAEMKVGELTPALQNALDKFTLDVTAKAKEGKIVPVFGRDTAIRQMVDILSRRRKNNPIWVGEPGVGKTALVEGLCPH